MARDLGRSAGVLVAFGGFLSEGRDDGEYECMGVNEGIVGKGSGGRGIGVVFLKEHRLSI